MKGNAPFDRQFAAIREQLSSLEESVAKMPEGERTSAMASLAALRHSLGGLAASRRSERKEHRLSKEELAGSARRYQMLLDSLDVGVYRATPDMPGHFLHVNREMAEMFGFSVRELMQVSAVSLCQDADEWGRFIAKLRAGGVAKDDEVLFKRQDGSPLWAVCSATPKFDDAGEILWIDGVLKDITWRKNAERELEETRERFLMLMKTFPGVIFMTGTEEPYPVELLGGDVEGVFGYSVQDCLEGRVRIADLVCAEDLEKVNAEVREALAERRSYSVDVRCRTRSGGVVWVHEIGSGIGGEPGNPRYIAGCMINVTREKQAQKRLDEAFRRLESLEAILERSPVAVLLIKVGDGFPVELASGNLRQFGYVAEELTAHGSSWIHLLHPDDVIRTKRELAQFESEGRTEFVQNYRLRTGSGEYRWVEDFTLVRMDENGRPDHYEVILHDVTERHEARDRARGYQRRLRALAARLSLEEDRERRRIAEALHDHIGQNLALASVNVSSAKRQEDALKRAVLLDKASGFVKASLNYVRLHTFELSSPVLYEQGLEAGLEALVKMMRQSHAMKMGFNDDGQPKPLGQEAQIALYQSAREMLVNAVKHADAKGVSVSISRNGNDVLVRVSDDGKGFEPSDVLGNAKTGGGFGLFSVRERLDFMGGRLELHSAPGEGTLTVMALPLSGGGETQGQGFEDEGNAEAGEVGAGWGV